MSLHIPILITCYIIMSLQSASGQKTITPSKTLPNDLWNHFWMIYTKRGLHVGPKRYNCDHLYNECSHQKW